MKNILADTIVAQCTPQGSGALALIRLSGDNALDIAQSFIVLPHNNSLLTALSHTIHFGSIVFNNETIDQVMIAVLHAPRTFTGETTIEITCHNNQLIIDEILRIALIWGARLAQPGEFAQRAFLHNKIDLIQAEAIHELITAQTQDALKRSTAQLRGSLSSWITDIEKELIRLLAWSEASFEFLDDEQEFGEIIKEQINQLQSKITEVLKSFSLSRQIREGFRIALIGSVNAGKSSLFNALIGQQRAIVTPLAGTTRDVIESTLTTQHGTLTLIDTAGLRMTDDLIEQEGIARSHQEAIKADCILLLIDSTAHLTMQEQAEYKNIIEKYYDKTLIVFTKIDVCSTLPSYEWVIEHLAVSSTSGVNLGKLMDAITKNVHKGSAQLSTPFLLNKRHAHLLEELHVSLLTIQNLLCGTIPYELVSYHLRMALERLSALTGKSVSEAGLDAVFREFCVGK